ncbi:hypothetical protein [Paenibacillus odorifer]|uniref:hypothetical protein n=1 Tax=Paenibacillus odorifer TaxID=189426 RepID=UPI0009700D61|nr:hypothetical protein [Paenibacillus odorifer]OMD09831.1 hypothetical protein BJP50_29300 [Paenibacillus odorifer]
MNENYIMIFNKMFDREFLITPRQLFIYSFIYRRRLFFSGSWRTEISVENIRGMINCKIEGRGNDKRNHIISDLLTLKQKGFICFSNKIEPISHKEILIITFLNRNQEDDNNNFTKIPYDIFDLFKDKNKFWVYTYISRFGEYGKTISYSSMSELSGIPINTLSNRIIKEMNTSAHSPRIYKFSGSYIHGDGAKQEENRYFSDSCISLDKQSEYNKLYDDDGNVRYKRCKKLKLEDEFSFILEGESISCTVSEFNEYYVDPSSWGRLDELSYGINKYEELYYYDYAIYRVSVDFNIDAKWNKRYEKSIQNMKLYPDIFKYDWEEWEKRYIEESMSKLDLNEKCCSK